MSQWISLYEYKRVYLSERYRKDPEETCWKEKAEFQIKYGQLIEKIDTDDWTPGIKKRFEDGLDFLKVSLKLEKVTSAQELTK